MNFEIKHGFYDSSLLYEHQDTLSCLISQHCRTHTHALGRVVSGWKVTKKKSSQQQNKLHPISVKGVAKYGVDTFGKKRSPVAPDVLPNRGDPIIPNVEYHHLIKGGYIDKGFATFLFWTNLDS